MPVSCFFLHSALGPDISHYKSRIIVCRLYFTTDLGQNWHHEYVVIVKIIYSSVQRRGNIVL
jgi:hypothetical protein